MEEHLEAIRAALAAPTEEARRAAANACRAILQSLEIVEQLCAGAKPSSPAPLHVVPTSSSVPSVQGTAAEPLPEPSPPPSASQDKPPTVVAAPSVGVSSEASPLTVLPAGAALGTLFGRGAGGAIDPAVVAAFVSAVKNLKPEQWVDLILSKLLTLVGTPSAASPMTLHPGGVPAPPTAAPVAHPPYQQIQLLPARPGWVAPPSGRRR